jgi:subtilase family serine protease
LPAKQHSLVFSIDQGREIAELSELNNTDSLIVEAIAPAGPAPVAAPSPQPTGPQGDPSGAQAGHDEDQADLTVRAIRVNGQAPDGKNDCKAGKNDLTVVIKNGGKGEAGRFAVRLGVDGDNREATVDRLDAGKEREVSFPNLPLTAGQHTLTAAVDPGQSVSESSDDNNDLRVTARCNGAG